MGRIYCLVLISCGGSLRKGHLLRQDQGSQELMLCRKHRFGMDMWSGWVCRDILWCLVGLVIDEEGYDNRERRVAEKRERNTRAQSSFWY